MPFRNHDAGELSAVFGGAGRTGSACVLGTRSCRDGQHAPGHDDGSPSADLLAWLRELLAAEPATPTVVDAPSALPHRHPVA
jgi:hypothetical protein